jgi:glutaredoxin 3
MKNVEIYSRPVCGVCSAARSLLDRKSVAYVEVNVWENPDRKPEMVQRAGGRSTFPQIFIGGEHIGGCDDLMSLESRGKLDGMLA